MNEAPDLRLSRHLIGVSGPQPAPELWRDCISCGDNRLHLIHIREALSLKLTCRSCGSQTQYHLSPVTQYE